VPLANVSNTKSIIRVTGTFTLDIIQARTGCPSATCRAIPRACPTWRVERSKKGIALDWSLYLGSRRETESGRKGGREREGYKGREKRERRHPLRTPFRATAPFSMGHLSRILPGRLPRGFHQSCRSPLGSLPSTAIPEIDIYLACIPRDDGPLPRRRLSIPCRRYRATESTVPRSFVGPARR